MNEVLFHTQGSVPPSLLFNVTLKSLGVGLVVHDRTGAIVLCNQPALDMLGLTHDQLLGKSSLDPAWNVIRADGSDFPGDEHPAMVALETGESQSGVVMGVFRPLTRDRVWLLVNTTAHRGPHADVEYVVACFNNISQWRQLELENDAQQQRFRATIEGSSEAVYIMGAVYDERDEVVDFELEEVNERACHQMGMSRQELVGLHICKAFPINVEAGLFERYKAVMLSKKGFEQELMVPAGQPGAGWYLQRVVPLEEGVASMIWNITLFKEANARLEQRLERQVLLNELSKALVTVNDTNHEPIIRSSLAQVVQSLGADGACIFLATPDQSAQCAYAWRAEGTTVMPTGKHVEPGKCLMEQGEVLFAQPVKKQLKLPLFIRGVVGGVMVVFSVEGAVDWGDDEELLVKLFCENLSRVFERLEVERTLREREERLRSFISQTRDAMLCFEYDPPICVDAPVQEQVHKILRGRLVEANEQAQRVWGGVWKGSDNIIGALIPDKTERKLLVERFVKDNYSLESVPHNQARFGRQLALSGVGVVQGDMLHRAWLRIRDTTDAHRQEQAQERMRKHMQRVQTLESIGVLAGGIAHDFNNLLLAITTYSQLALQDMRDDPDEARESIRQVLAAGERAAEMTRRLQAFGRSQESRKAPTELGALVAGMLRILRRVIPASVQVDFAPPPHPYVAHVDPNQIEQVIMNLCLNASDAIEGIGRIDIKLHSFELGSFDPLIPELPPGAWLMLSVRDDGCGMPPDVQERIFEPFFTTKGTDKGTGLGLAVVYGVVTDHDGVITVDSQPSEGTTFNIFLPASEEPVHIGSTVELQDQALNGQGTILVAEDDPMVRGLVQRVLEKAGYTVITTVNGAQAVERFEQQHHNIDLVLLDAIMPIMNGWEAYDAITSIQPDIPVLFCSGYSHGVFPPGFFDGTRQMLSKPYQSNELLREIRRLIPHAPPSQDA